MKTTAQWALSLAAWSARILPKSIVQGLYRLGPAAALIRRFLNRTAPEGRSVVAIAAGSLEGRRMELDLQTEKDYWLGTYEPQLQASVADFARPGQVAYDVGANIGYISLMLAEVVGPDGQVFAFEALPENVGRLQTNVALNELERIVTIVPAAVIEASRPVEFIVGRSGSTGKASGSAGREPEGEPTVRVSGLSLDEFIYQSGNPPPQLVKIDIEGGEIQALPGMERLLEEHSPTILLELHGPEAANAAWEVLTRNRYTLRKMEPGYPPVGSLEQMDWKTYVLASRQ